jgi:hypothetical protein
MAWADRLPRRCSPVVRRPWVSNSRWARRPDLRYNQDSTVCRSPARGGSRDSRHMVSLGRGSHQATVALVSCRPASLDPVRSSEVVPPRRRMA